MPIQVRQVRDFLKDSFEDLIDVGDLESRPSSEREQAFLSRSLAALVVHNRTGCDHAAAAHAVIDGRNDHGIDAVAVDYAVPQLWLVQAKWSDQGRAGFSVADTLKLIEGFSLIDQHKFTRFNDRFQGFTDRIKEVMRNPRVKVTFVIALMGIDELSSDVVQHLNDAQTRFNSYGSMLEYEVCNVKDVWRIVRDNIAEPPISLNVKMAQWMHLAEPFDAYYGTVAVGDVASWYAELGRRLFTRNIRTSLGLTHVNQGLVETLTSAAENFWYFNNGITVLCDSIDPYHWSRSSHGPVELNLQGASVVNGAQTVAAIYQAIHKDPEASSMGYVGVRVISMRGCPEGFSVEITKATNTQNRVERRDFVALDPLQSKIREDFVLSLQRSYVVKRGEMDPPPEMGCSVVHAATALACAYHTPDLVVRARRDPDLLWESGDQGAYTLLFKKGRPSVYRVWRSVLLYRAIGSALQQSKKGREGRAAAIADHGDLLIAHLVFQGFGIADIDDPDGEWDQILVQVPDVTELVVAWLIHHVDDAYGSTSFISSTFRNPERCQMLAERVLLSLREGIPVPELPTDYRPAAPGPRTRRRRAVATLVDAGRIPDGTMLTFVVGGDFERLALEAWLAEDARRERATWVNERSRPLLWSADGLRYSPTGLVQHMWRLAGWGAAPGAVQGTRRWLIQEGGSLAQLAEMGDE